MCTVPADSNYMYILDQARRCLKMSRTQMSRMKSSTSMPAMQMNPGLLLHSPSNVGANALMSTAMTLQEAAALHEGLFLAATLGGMLVARATPDGRFTVLHNLARPPDAREGCLPYPTWQPRPPASRPASSSTRWLQSSLLNVCLSTPHQYISAVHLLCCFEL